MRACRCSRDRDHHIPRACRVCTAAEYYSYTVPPLPTSPPPAGPLDKVARAADRAGQAAKNFVTDDRHTAENKVLFCVTEQHVRDALKLLGAAAALTVLVGAGVTWGPRIRVGHLVERRLPVRHMRCAQPQRRAEGVAEDLEEGTKTTARRWGRKARDARDAAGDALDAAGDSLEYAARETTHKARSTAGMCQQAVLRLLHRVQLLLCRWYQAPVWCWGSCH